MCIIVDKVVVLDYSYYLQHHYASNDIEKDAENLIIMILFGVFFLFLFDSSNSSLLGNAHGGFCLFITTITSFWRSIK